jgi:hypothetical protein
MTGLGTPSSPDQVANKGYVDSTVNKINTGRAYVDKAGNDATARLNDSVLPYKTIQAAINAAYAVATTSNRYIVTVSPGIYTEDITIKNYVSLTAFATEATFIYGTVTIPPAYTDLIGQQLDRLSIVASNNPAIVINAGSDEAYFAIRSCYIKSDYDDDKTNKPAILVNRGRADVCGTSYIEMNIASTNGDIQYVHFIEHTTDPSNPGLSQFNSITGSYELNSADPNDEISLMRTYDNTDTTCINNLQGGIFNISLNISHGIPSNKFMIVSHKNAQGRTLAQNNIVRLNMFQYSRRKELPTTNVPPITIIIGFCIVSIK